MGNRRCPRCGCGGSWLVLAVHFLLLVSISTARKNTSHIEVDDTNQRRELATNLPVLLNVYQDVVVIDNGIVQVTFSNAGGEVIGIKYGGIDNLLETHNKFNDRGYLDVVWNWPGQPSKYEKVYGSKFNIITQTEDTVEISFARTWDQTSPSHISPFIIDKRFIMRRNIAGFYSYAIFDHPEGWPGLQIGEARVAYKLNGDQFHFMAISDEKQRVMPTPWDRSTGQTLAYPEAVLLTNPSNPDLKGEVDDKYQYSSDTMDDSVHGWISTDPMVGLWMISPSHEFRSGGPVKQELTCHVGPTVLNTFITSHYAGRDIATVFANGEPWKKVFGPYMVYLNSNPPQGHYYHLWNDAKRQMTDETQNWPYDFVQSQDFPPSAQRGVVGGQLLVRDRYKNNVDLWAEHAYVGLASPGQVGSWQTESKGYQFWTRADSYGKFAINNVREGVYNLYAWVPGTVGEYKHFSNLVVKPGSVEWLGKLVFEPPRSGPTLWEIGVPDRTAAEFYVPEPWPALTNKLYTNLKREGYRQYGLWEKYTELYPNGDLVYNVGTSDFRKDWFFAHVTRRVGNMYVPTTWQINFDLQDVNPTGIYTLQLALASATFSEIQVRFNDPNMGEPLFTTRLIGSDNAIARHGIYGLYHFYSVQVPGNYLRIGSNTLALTQSRATSPLQGVMYDYILLEGPPSSI